MLIEFACPDCGSSNIAFDGETFDGDECWICCDCYWTWIERENDQ